jgi:plastocyanin
MAAPPNDDVRPERASRVVTHDHADDGIDRRGFLQRMAWAWTGLLWSMQSGVPKATAMSALGDLDEQARQAIFFARVSDPAAAPGFAGANHPETQHPRTDLGRPALRANEVGIHDFAFVPRVLTVKVATEVTWINRDAVPHIIYNPQGKFPESPELATGRRYSHRFTAPGRYDCFCSIHARMTGVIVVQ